MSHQYYLDIGVINYIWKYAVGIMFERDGVFGYRIEITDKKNIREILEEKGAWWRVAEAIPLPTIPYTSVRVCRKIGELQKEILFRLPNDILEQLV